MHARLASDTDLAGFRDEARSLLAQQVPPEEVQWETAPAGDSDLFADPPGACDSRPHGVPRAAAAIVPASFSRLCELVVLHNDPARFALLYRLLWRLVHEPALRNDPIDTDMLQAQQMGQAVRRDMHKMKALVRFRPAQGEAGAGRALHLAWFEPAHHIVETVAPWFAKRVPSIHWALLTPQRSVQWDGQQLHFGPGATGIGTPPDPADEAAWLASYRRIFGRQGVPQELVP
jgi:probable DNA metabolism protein